MLVSKLTLGRQAERGSPLPQPPSSRGIAFIASLPRGCVLGVRDAKGEALEGRRGVSLGPASSGQRDRERVSCWAARLENERGGHGPWCFFPSQITQPQALPSGGRAEACQHLLGALGLVFCWFGFIFRLEKLCTDSGSVLCVHLCLQNTCRRHS